ncbi:DNA cytosine methyltransferase [Streptomyces sp. ActVer]|uniref:DNA cytosine methyltransferase n=1 Tax=Streptomyces sp. ActVer TaxID=3014558 RepID=UPI0022B3814C|nr:DNA cytosine methyltransferase [Streptomyces sp. ActVer]MCZ4508319.1 DNA cytosine methyltransferase [Streptomyces sp. ActVer]
MTQPTDIRRAPGSPPTIVALCAGYGGLETAIREGIGGQVAAFAENDPYAAAVFAAHHPGVPNLGDITAVNWDQVRELHRPDVVAAGFPCRNISNAGRRDGINGQWSRVWKNVAQAVGVLRPRIVFLENVAAIRSRGRGLDVVAADLAALGYDAWWTCLRAGDAEVGAPHPRDRWFAVAHPADADPDHGGRYRWTRHQPQPQGRTEPPHGSHEAARTAGRLTLLPTPKASDGPHGGPNQRDTSGRYYLPGQAVRLDARWVSTDGTDYGPAIRRWERITGRAAPCPTEPGTRGNRRLSPAFAEWLMGLPAGWVTAVPGIPRKEQLKILGNGVVPRQARHAYGLLLGAHLPARLEWEAAA